MSNQFIVKNKFVTDLNNIYQNYDGKVWNKNLYKVNISNKESKFTKESFEIHDHCSFDVQGPNSEMRITI